MWVGFDDDDVGTDVYAQGVITRSPAPMVRPCPLSSRCFLLLPFYNDAGHHRHHYLNIFSINFLADVNFVAEKSIANDHAREGGKKNSKRGWIGL